MAGLRAAERLRERHQDTDVRQLFAMHADFNLDLCRLGPAALRVWLADQFMPADRTRFMPGNGQVTFSASRARGHDDFLQTTLDEGADCLAPARVLL